MTYGAGVDLAVRAVDELDVEILDLRTVWPLDDDAILESLAKTSRILVLQEAARSIGAAGQVLSLVAREGFELLDAPPALVAPPDTPVPFAPELEDAYIPSVERVRAALEELACATDVRVVDARRRRARDVPRDVAARALPLMLLQRLVGGPDRGALPAGADRRLRLHGLRGQEGVAAAAGLALGADDVVLPAQP